MSLRTLTENDRVFIQNSNKTKFIMIKEIVVISSLGNYSKIELIDGEKLLIRKTLTACENILPESLFLRVHRKSIINLNFVTQISQWSNGTYRIRLKGIDEPFTLSRGYASIMKRKLEF